MPDWKKSNSIHDTEVMEVGRYRLTVSPTGAATPAPTHQWKIDLNQWKIDLNHEHGGGDLDWEPTDSMETAKAEAVAALEKHLIDTLFELRGITGAGAIHLEYPKGPKYGKGDRVCFIDPADPKTYIVENHYTFGDGEWLYDIGYGKALLQRIKEKELFPVENCDGSPELDDLVEQAVADVENGDVVELP